MLIAQATQWKKETRSAADQWDVTAGLTFLSGVLSFRRWPRRYRNRSDPGSPIRDSQDPMTLTAQKTGIAQHRQDKFPVSDIGIAQTQKLQLTHTGTHITMARMLKYADQLMDLSKDPNSIVKYQSLKPAETRPR